MAEDIKKRFYDITGESNVKEYEPMKMHTTFRAGGPARYYICPHTVSEISQILQVCREYELSWFILGRGSDLLVSDQGYDGVIIQMYQNFDDIAIEGNQIRALSGALLSRIAARAQKASLGGFEFASGIPGTLGGAVMMNAGAYGGEMKQVLAGATVMDQAGNVIKLAADELHLGYRTSVIKEKNYIVLEAILELIPKDKEEILVLMNDLQERRACKQPLEYPSAGSTFKRPKGYFAGKLIMDSGLRGYCVGGACVSEKHCGFVINRDNASASEIYQLISYIRRTVHERFGVWLEPEVKMLGKFD
ncbi:UDP-N-acetylmuramate dehydrogenase [Blautia liquoris]|uniref:UDP-N-acetylenolpyruvoylglucosamine reductase n=1 Tax=Blautia liquoris TaxID=2779518 RepID=A0A7M2RJM0_9FIRM|nr:UDP-N-acetylmuramate dehydrogenase [Blautia liquoris]QOV19757.1 UDP-N-acetylmuramate dehydrogenase [Blautia liquoris]